MLGYQGGHWPPFYLRHHRTPHKAAHDSHSADATLSDLCLTKRILVGYPTPFFLSSAQTGAMPDTMLKIRTTRPDDWPAIMAIQRECYHQFEPEPLAVMRNKAELAPDSCWVAEHRDRVLGYLFCHPWRAHQPPPLSVLIQAVPMLTLAGDGEFYLHDLAVASQARGLGIGQRLIETALAFASHQGYGHAGLVAVQDAPAFWRKWGFMPSPTSKPLGEYGDGAVYMRLALTTPTAALPRRSGGS